MEKINISFKIINDELSYSYNGIASINKDLIEFNDDDFNYIFDKKIKRLIKSKKDYSTIIDFLNKNIKIIDNDKEINIEIELKKIKINRNNIDIIYKIDNNDIVFEIKEVK